MYHISQSLPDDFAGCKHDNRMQRHLVPVDRANFECSPGSWSQYWSQCCEMMLLAITHNIAIILLIKELFYRARPDICNYPLQSTPGAFISRPLVSSSRQKD